jgi:transcriptional regulator with XRE-family HTH domain
MLSPMESGPATALGEVIRRQRELNELSMRRFASMAGISNPYLSQIERGLRAPSERVVDAIARSLDMSASALYEQAGIRPLESEEGPGARAAIEADERLTDRQRRALLEVYDSFAALNRRGT